MEKMLEALVDELAKRVLAKMGEDQSNMREFLKLKVRAEDVEGLDDWIDNKIDDLKGECVSAAEDCVKDIIETMEVEVESTASINHG